MHTGRFWLFAILFLTTASLCFSQVEQPKRFEIEIHPFDKPFDVINGEEDGVLLVRDTNDRSDKGDPKYEMISLDTSLQVHWRTDLYIDRFWEYRGYDYYDGAFYLLFKFNKTNSKDFKIMRLDNSDGSNLVYTISNLVPLELTNFEMTHGAALIGGYFNYNPVVVHFTLSTGKSKVLPGIYQPKTDLIQVKVDDSKDSFVVIVSEKTYDKRNTLAVKTYDSSGTLIGNETLEPDLDKGLIYGRAADFDYDLSLLGGTYSTKRGTYSRGLFVAIVGEEGDHEINYYNFGDLENFFDYMRAKKRKRVKERIERKKIQGKKIKFNYRLLVHDIIENKNQFVMIGEAFYPKYNTSPNYAYASSAYRGSGKYGTYFAGYRYTHAVVIGFDKGGRILWDNSFEIEDVLSWELDQYVHAHVKDERIVLLYLYDNEIRSKIIEKDKVMEGKSFNEIQLTFEDDVLRDSNSEIGGLEPWFESTFYAYGTQRIKNLKDLGVKLNRRVFYINKVKYN